VGGDVRLRGVTMEKGWTTDNEKKFLDGLGTGKWKKGWGPSRRELLRRYLESLEGRVRWGGVDKRAVEEYARSLLEECNAEE